MNLIEKIVESRKHLLEGLPEAPRRKKEDEGGCGVIGAAATFPIEGRHLLPALCQMRNRGNGKGGGVAMLGLAPEDWGVSRQVLDEDYALQIAYLDPTARQALESEFIM